jgi:hypothetical protein
VQGRRALPNIYHIVQAVTAGYGDLVGAGCLGPGPTDWPVLAPLLDRLRSQDTR